VVLAGQRRERYKKMKDKLVYISETPEPRLKKFFDPIDAEDKLLAALMGYCVICYRAWEYADLGAPKRHKCDNITICSCEHKVYSQGRK
jgi:hypothetical protein